MDEEGPKLLLDDASALLLDEDELLGTAVMSTKVVK